ncbi:lipase family protein [Pseudomonas sp. SWRI153]|uniref:Lipase family protein n=1 Tax=Pseudomonas khorasanensis TaxID=2745508 RepID=A0A923F2Z0_9PSED|nr:lipase family protein [Pseudomonas khorasanensis]MBV4485785.1 lipase family protein [Pseudomonas khorasanensis]
MTSMEKELESPLSSRVLACPAQGRWSSFQLVDEFGSGEPYAGLAYVVIDSEGKNYDGNLDATGSGKIADHFAGPIALTLEKKYQGEDMAYVRAVNRRHYPLEITELQVRAEQTRYVNHNSTRTKENPARTCADEFFQVEVRHLVQHVSHLPPQVYSLYPTGSGPAKIMGKHYERGVVLMPLQHTVLEVRPMRALRPMLSTDPAFCALNLYQLALMATLSYCPFGQEPKKHPVETKTVSFPVKPTVGNWFGDALAKFEELGKVDATQEKAYYPLFEDVPYSRRLEVVPFDPTLYSANDPQLGVDQEHPANIHFFDDRISGKQSTDTQAFITHHDELILISVRGTYELIADGLRDADAFQVPFEDTDSKVHRGFYEAAQKAAVFVARYLDRFYAGQKLLICGHSLGGAVALLLSEMLRRRPEGYNIQLYTYGAPRAGDANFTLGAKDLVHHRMVAHNDPVPSVPGTWMNTKTSVFGTGAVLTFVNVPVGLSVFVAGITNWTGEPYEHHGTLYHAMQVQFDRNEKSMILWKPGCDTVAQHAACSVAIQLQNGLPDRPSLLAQLFSAGSHSMVGSYIPACWATLKRWQEAQTMKRPIVTEGEFKWVETALLSITAQLRYKRGQTRPDAYVRHDEKINVALNLEIDRIQVTIKRLRKLQCERTTEQQVYGSLSTQPEQLSASLSRWLAHAENQVVEQLAMAPTSKSDNGLLASIYGHTVGAPHKLDIDSYI